MPTVPIKSSNSCPSVISCRLVQTALGNGCDVRKVYVKFEQIVPHQDNIDTQTAKGIALTEALAYITNP